MSVGQIQTPSPAVFLKELFEAWPTSDNVWDEAGSSEQVFKHPLQLKCLPLLYARYYFSAL